ncbi:MAG: hypothetical protein ACI3ZA_02045 [Alloprevotella sp.]
MKNFFRKSFAMLFMALACASFAFVACGDDDDENGNGGQQTPPAQQDQTGLVGTWKGQYTDDGQTYSLTVCINADNTGWDNFGGEKEIFTWYTEGDKVVVIYPKGNNKYYENVYYYKISGNQLYLYERDYYTQEKELAYILTRQ